MSYSCRTPVTVQWLKCSLYFLPTVFVMSLVCITFKRRTCEHGFVSTISSLMAAVKIWLTILRATHVNNICQKMFCLFCRQGKAIGWSYSHVLACLAIWQGLQGKKENVDGVEAGTCFAADICCIRSWRLSTYNLSLFTLTPALQNNYWSFLWLYLYFELVYV